MTPAGPDALVALAPAKVNLHLEVTGKRPDGFHGIETLMVAVDLFDTLEVRDDPTGRLELRCNDPTLPTDAGNLVYRAAELVKTRFAPGCGVTIRLTKRIPHQAGLGGGSSDAATALRTVNRVWRLNLSADTLRELAAELGSDVGFFLTPPAGWCTGRGEVVSPVPVGRRLDVVIVKPAAGLATAGVYRALTVPSSPTDGTPVRAALAAGDVEAVGRLLHNRLERPATALCPAVGDVLDRLRATTPLGCRLSGSGSAAFAVCRDRADAVRVAAQVRAAWPVGEPPPQVFVVRSWPPE